MSYLNSLVDTDLGKLVTVDEWGEFASSRSSHEHFPVNAAFANIVRGCGYLARFGGPEIDSLVEFREVSGTRTIYDATSIRLGVLAALNGEGPKPLIGAVKKSGYPQCWRRVGERTVYFVYELYEHLKEQS